MPGTGAGAQSRAEVVSERGRGSSEWEGEKSVKRESDGGGGAQTFCYLDEYVRQVQVVGDTVVCGAPSASSPPPPLAPLAAPGAASRDPLAPEAHTLEPP